MAADSFCVGAIDGKFVAAFCFGVCYENCGMGPALRRVSQIGENTFATPF